MAASTRPQQRREPAFETPEQRKVSLQRRDEILDFVGKYAGEIEKLAPKGTSADYHVASLRLYFQEHEKLLQCRPISIALGILRVAQTGLTLGVGCDLLPFGNVCQFSPRYTGIIELALASGTRAINVGVVREGDHFEFTKGTSSFLHHQPIAKSDAPITHGYAIAEIKQGAFSIEVMTAEQIDAHRKRYSKQWWLGDNRQVIALEEIPWYAKKTPLRQLSNVLPKNPRLSAALIFEKEREEEIPEGEFEAVDESTPTVTTTPGAPATATVAADAPSPQQLEDWQFQDDRGLDDYPGRR